MSTNYENENYENFENEGTEAGCGNGKGLLALVGGGALLLGGLTVAGINKLKAKKAEKADKPKKTKKKLKLVPVEDEVEENVDAEEEDVEEEPEQKGKNK